MAIIQIVDLQRKERTMKTVEFVDMTVGEIAKAALLAGGGQFYTLRNVLILADRELVPMPERPARALVDHGYLKQDGDGFAFTDMAKEIVTEALESWSLHPVTRVNALIEKARTEPKGNPTSTKGL
jgi:hypothetical protein